MTEFNSEKDNEIRNQLGKVSKADLRSQELPGELGKVFLAIENRVISLNAEWGAYEQLFASEDDWRLLVGSSPFGWTLIHDALVERSILRITRLVETGKRRMAFGHFIQVLKSLHHNDLAKSLQADIAKIREKAVPLKALRDKVLAHTMFDSMKWKLNWQHTTSCMRIQSRKR